MSDWSEKVPSKIGDGISLELAKTALPGHKILSNTTTVTVHVKP